MATLRTVERIWRLERQNKNAAEIANRAGKIHDKLCGFVGDLEKIGKELKTHKMPTPMPQTNFMTVTAT